MARIVIMWLHEYLSTSTYYYPSWSLLSWRARRVPMRVCVCFQLLLSLSFRLECGSVAWPKQKGLVGARQRRPDDRDHKRVYGYFEFRFWHCKPACRPRPLNGWVYLVLFNAVRFSCMTCVHSKSMIVIIHAVMYGTCSYGKGGIRRQA